MLKLWFNDYGGNNNDDDDDDHLHSFLFQLENWPRNRSSSSTSSSAIVYRCFSNLNDFFLFRERTKKFGIFIIFLMCKLISTWPIFSRGLSLRSLSFLSISFFFSTILFFFLSLRLRKHKQLCRLIFTYYFLLHFFLFNQFNSLRWTIPWIARLTIEMSWSIEEPRSRLVSISVWTIGSFSSLKMKILLFFFALPPYRYEWKRLFFEIIKNPKTEILLDRFHRQQTIANIIIIIGSMIVISQYQFHFCQIDLILINCLCGKGVQPNSSHIKGKISKRGKIEIDSIKFERQWL